MQCMSPVRIYNQKLGRYIDVPCGKCPACYRNRRRQWSLRLMLESVHHTTSHFVTLTYDDFDLPRDSLGNPTFDKVQVQKFMKRFRKSIAPYKVRYFLVSEFGSRGQRPHYHMILFGFPSCLDIDEYLLKAWTFGFADVGTVTPKSINYVCKYCLAFSDIKSLDDDHYLIGDQIVPRSSKPFMLCSSHPALGSGYLTPSQRVRFRNMRMRGKSPLIHVNGSMYGVPRLFKDKVFSQSFKLLHPLNDIPSDDCDEHNRIESLKYDISSFNFKYEKTKHF